MSTALDDAITSLNSEVNDEFMFDERDFSKDSVSKLSYLNNKHQLVLESIIAFLKNDSLSLNQRDSIIDSFHNWLSVDENNLYLFKKTISHSAKQEILSVLSDLIIEFTRNPNYAKSIKRKFLINLLNYHSSETIRYGSLYGLWYVMESKYKDEIEKLKRKERIPFLRSMFDELLQKLNTTG